MNKLYEKNKQSKDIGEEPKSPNEHKKMGIKDV